MYILKRNNRRYGNKVFNTYEKARYYARQKMASDGIGSARTASLRDAGFSVERREA